MRTAYIEHADTEERLHVTIVASIRKVRQHQNRLRHWGSVHEPMHITEPTRHTPHRRCRPCRCWR